MTEINDTMKFPSVPAFVGIDLAKYSVHVRGCEGWKPSTGGKNRLLIHGARAVVNQTPRKEKLDMRGQWLKGLLDRRHRNIATVALANRMARTAWAVLNSGQPYRSHHVPV